MNLTTMVRTSKVYKNPKLILNAEHFPRFFFVVVLFYGIFGVFNGFLIKFSIIAYEKVSSEFFSFSCIMCLRVVLINITFLFEDALIRIKWMVFIIFHRFHRTFICICVCVCYRDP